MRRLPSEPEHIRKEKVREWSEKWRRRRFIGDMVLLSMILILGISLCIKNSDFVKNLKFRFNSTDCVIHSIDYDYGKGVYFESEGETALIDSGTESHSEELLNFIRTKGIEKLDYLLISDPDEKYLDVLSAVTESTEISRIIISQCDDSLFAAYDDFAFENLVTLSSADNMRYFSIGEMNFDILDAETMSAKVFLENNSFLIYNSCSEETELEIMNFSSYYDFDVLISLDGNLPSQKFIETVTPENIVINGDEKDTADLTASGEIYRTVLNGDVIIKSNGVDFEFECENQ
ncbi:MAG: hypothetical protein J6B52_01945 [Clostridia bacterium]|nr:hypothetical protein [Clostridia bacterium]